MYLGDEMRLTLRYSPSDLGYWSLIVYDRWGLPLAQYAYDENCRFIKEEASRTEPTNYIPS